VTSRVAIFGGSFNPPHVAHALACALLLSIEDVDRVLVIPTFRHPFAKALAPFEDRLAMCELAMGWIPGVEVSPVEAELGGESRTLHTLEHLTNKHPDWRLRLVIGGDILAEAHRWYGFDTISAIAPPLVLGRAGAGADVASAGRALLPDVSSTQVRALVAAGAWDELARLVPRRVLDYVRSRSLYAEPAPRAP
jgi:nicotinate-nucleotide adenylyltransferase